MGKRAKAKELVVPVLKASAPSQSGDSDVSDLESLTQASVTTFTPEDESVTIDQLIFEAETSKSNSSRVKSLKHLIEYERRAATAYELTSCSEHLMSTLEKYFRRESSEASLACICASLFSIIVGMDTEYDVTRTTSILADLIKDKACAFRASAAQSLGLIIHFTLDSPMHLEEACRVLFDAWSTFKTDSPSNADFTAILNAWLLVLNDASTSTKNQAFDVGVVKLTKYLESDIVEIRISAGEALAFLYQLGCESDDEFEFFNHQHLKNLFEDIVHESGKSHAKKDKRSQRFSFRQIMDVIFDDEYPCSVIKYANREQLEISSCLERLIYDLLCVALQGDLNLHIKRNLVVREAFSLAQPKVVESSLILSKNEKKELRQQNLQTNKLRQIHRNKQRDKKGY